MIEPFQDSPVKEVNVRLIFAPDSECCLANNSCRQHSSGGKESFFHMVKEFHALQAEIDLREYTQEG